MAALVNGEEPQFKFRIVCEPTTHDLPPESQPPHYFRHLQRGLGGFGSAIMRPAQATHLRVLFLFKNKHAVNDRNFALNLDLRQRVRHAPADVLRMARLALKNYAEADDCGKRRAVGCAARQL